ncbi:hypothetical protein [Agaribacter flavus]|uniref:Uncharacterized protein n=1 Tax=Agaribacter flavus TaxID=1902781 RepID=A0ABV7FUY8_9ALTE
MNMISRGIIKADDWNVELSANTSENELLSSELKNDLGKLVHNGEFRSYYTSKYDVQGKSFVFRIYFESGVLKSVALSPVSGQPSWDAVEEAKLKQDKDDNDKWLLDKFSLKAPSSFTWGVLESVLDMKGGSSKIIMRFKH